MTGLSVVLAFAIAAIVLVVITSRLKSGVGAAPSAWPVYAKRLLSPVEQKLYQRLIRAFPDHVVLAQVALSQVVGVKNGQDSNSIRNRFNRLVADFVLCNRNFTVTAVFELDDRSHDHPKRQDADQRKAAVLRAAGIPLHRLNVNPLPNETELKDLVMPDIPPIRAVRG